MYGVNNMDFKTKPFDHQLDVFSEIKDLDYFALFLGNGNR